MVHKNKELDALYVNEKAKEALNQVFEELLIFVNAIIESENIQQINGSVKQQLGEIREKAENIQEIIVQEKLTMPEELNHLANQLNQAANELSEQKFEDKNGNILRHLAGIIPGTKAIEDMLEEKQLTQIHIRVMKAVETLREKVEIVLKNAKAQELLVWQKCLKACENFADVSKDKILNLVRKAKARASQGETQGKEQRTQPG